MNYFSKKSAVNSAHKIIVGIGVAILVSACTPQSPSSNYDVCTRVGGYFKSIERTGFYYWCTYNAAIQKYVIWYKKCPVGEEFNERDQKCEPSRPPNSSTNGESNMIDRA